MEAQKQEDKQHQAESAQGGKGRIPGGERNA